VVVFNPFVGGLDRSAIYDKTPKVLDFSSLGMMPKFQPRWQSIKIQSPRGNSEAKNGLAGFILWLVILLLQLVILLLLLVILTKSLP
jgi:hypothetical protein